MTWYGRPVTCPVCEYTSERRVGIQIGIVCPVGVAGETQQVLSCRVEGLNPLYGMNKC